MAVFPGVSRSGSTIAGGMARNLERPAAARFAFLISIPIMLAAGLLGTVELLQVPNVGDFLPIVAAGFTSSAVVGYLAIRWLITYLMRHSLRSFAIYCMTPASALDLNRSSLALRWGAGSSAIEFASVIGEEELVVVIHPDNPLQQISLEDLRAVYEGTLREWPDTQEEIEAWAYPAGEDVQEVFESAVFTGTAPASDKAWLAPDPRAMREAIAGNPAALGFLPRSWLDEGVRALPISGLEAGDLRQPVLALSKSEPIDPEKALLICLQQAPR
jgi:hypothetical protein